MSGKINGLDPVTSVARGPVRLTLPALTLAAVYL